MNEGPRIERVRHELKRRRLTVARVERLPPGMIRIALRGEELRGFTSLGFDDHIKIFVPTGAAVGPMDGPGTPVMRDFTPRRYDSESGELWIDFFVHADGPAATWASAARVGDSLEIGGPKGSSVIALEDIDAHVLIGDETAVPAIGRRLEELPASAHALVVLELEPLAESPRFDTRASLTVVRAPRSKGAEAPGVALITALRPLRLPSARCFFWIATESRAARALRRHLRDERAVNPKWIKAAGYWQRGASGVHDKLAED